MSITRRIGGGAGRGGGGGVLEGGGDSVYKPFFLLSFLRERRAEAESQTDVRTPQRCAKPAHCCTPKIYLSLISVPVSGP